MDYIKSLEADLEKGYSKSDLEKLIGLPKNNLSGILKGDRTLSKKSKLKIDKWEKSEKPDPLNLHELVYGNGAKVGQVADTKFTDLAKGVHKEILEVPIVELPEIEARIAKIQEMLLVPPKFLPSHKRTSLESELNKLKIQLMQIK